MEVSEDGTVTGSIDRAKLDEVEPKTDEAKAQLEQLKGEAQAAQEQADADAERVAAQAEAQAAQSTGEPEQDAGSDQPEDLYQLSKAELVDRANAQGVDTAGKTKAELVEALGGSVA
jgi:uncharacterized membrane protein YqiK